MIFRAPAGHVLISKRQLEKLKLELEYKQVDRALGWVEFLAGEIEFYDEIRKQWELRKMLEEEGEDVTALTQEIRNKVRAKEEEKTLFFGEGLNWS